MWRNLAGVHRDQDGGVGLPDLLPRIDNHPAQPAFSWVSARGHALNLLAQLRQGLVAPAVN